MTTVGIDGAGVAAVGVDGEGVAEYTRRCIFPCCAAETPGVSVSAMQAAAKSRFLVKTMAGVGTERLGGELGSESADCGMQRSIPCIGVGFTGKDASATERRWIFERWRINQVAIEATEASESAAETGETAPADGFSFWFTDN